MSVYIGMLDFTISELRSIAKGRSTDGYRHMSKKELEYLFTQPQRPKLPIPLPRPKYLKPI